MKKYIYYIASICLASTLTTACINLEEMNVNPNNATTTNPSLLLTGVSYKAFNQTSSSACHATKMLVYTAGESTSQFYKWTRGSFSNYGNMRDITKMMELSDNQSPYQAIGHFLRANYFFQLTLEFGDIPYSEALQGESNLNYTPSYDRQEQVLEGILNELDQANKILAKSNEVISGDIIYNSNLTKWRQLINAYRLRVLMTLSNKTSVGNINIASSFAEIVKNEPLMQSIEDNGQLIYLDQQGNRYPYFNDSDFGSGRFMDSTYIAALALRKDPRLFAIATQTPNAATASKAIDDFTAYDGGNPAVPYNLVNEKAVAGNCSKPTTRYYQTPTNEPMILLGYTEQQLILAEAVVRGWITGDDQTYYEEAVKASFAFYQKYATFVENHLTPDAAKHYLTGEQVAYKSTLTQEEKLERIAMQKYLPTFLQGSVWLPYYEALRTGYPDFHRAAGVALPLRWMYPQDEYNNNSTHVEQALQTQFGGSDKISNQPWWLQ
ncbi:MAG: SusD/RagB family nutrient-binding outer membrane lipoprotein [Phocaeicola sp.]